MGSSNPKYIEEKDIENNAISIPSSSLKVISDLADKCICKIQNDNNEKGTGFFVQYLSLINIKGCQCLLQIIIF